MLTQKFRFAALALAAGGLTVATPASAIPAAHASTWTSSAAYGDLTASYDDDDDDDDRRWGNRGRDNRYERKAERRYERDQRRYYRDQQRYARQQSRPTYNNYPANYGEPVYRNTRVWRGDDGRNYCRKSDGTTGLLIGGAAGALVGREVAGRNGDRTLGAILGAAGGALLGKSLDSKTRCG